jgi:exopolyphosphatase/guanosine-5'-triphosphate,3'-diphosphate pyrophosphatase
MARRRRAVEVISGDDRPAGPVRVAAIDLGTNTTRLLVADVDDGRVAELHRETRITRLGEGVDARRRLLPAPIARVRNVLVDYRKTAEALGAVRTLLVATSAVRDAENGEAFLGEIEWSYGFATRLLSGSEEAELTRRGVGGLEAGTLLVDIGGGSTELVLDDERASLPMGSVRFSERYGEDLAQLEAAAQALLPPLEPRRAVGVAATITTLAALDLGLPAYDRERVHGHLLSRCGARAQLERLAALPLPARRQVPALEPERAPVIVAGAAILLAILDRYRLAGIQVSEHDLLDGAALAAAELPEPSEGPAPPGAYTCC